MTPAIWEAKLIHARTEQGSFYLINIHICANVWASSLIMCFLFRQ